MDTDMDRQLEKVCGLLRKMHYSFEEIAHHIEDARPEKRLEPWQVYGYCNPEKTPAQVAEWRRKHYPTRWDGTMQPPPPISPP